MNNIVFHVFIIYPLIIAFFLSLLLGTLSLKNFNRTGPKIKQEIEKNFRCYAIFAFLRLCGWAFLFFFLMALAGTLSLGIISSLTGLFNLNASALLLSGLVFCSIISCYQFLQHLLYIPSSLQISFSFRFSRLFPLWKLLSPFLLTNSKNIFLFLFSGLLLSYAVNNINNIYTSILTISILISYWLILILSTEKKEPVPIQSSAQHKHLNIIMIGADTLRYDRLGQVKNNIDITPNINKLINQGTLLTNCITPLARTAPSLASLFTGLWPHHHKIRSNFLYASEFNLPQKTLIERLNAQGYYTAAVSDWAGSDFGKINFGFEKIQVPKDQWNLKLLLRQGPPLLRLFLSLFTHNGFGKKFLPELYYLAGVPLTKELGRDFRHLIVDAAKKDQPFLLNLFTSTTHVPFGSEYPYYNLFTPKDYAGESRFIMTKLATPEEIMQKQELGVEAFDLPQILNLYDGCTKQFDDEVGRIVDFVDQCGLTDSTVFIVYSDHGADFFETGCWGQGNTLRGNDPSGRIPVVLKGPKIPKNLRFDHLSRSIDLMPTLLALLDMESDPCLDGVNLLANLYDNTHPELFAFQETGEWMAEVPGMHPAQLRYPNIVDLLDIPDKKTGTLVINKQYYDLVIRAKNRSVQNESWKLIYIPTDYGIEYELYDLKSDPNCEVNQLLFEVEIFNDLKAILEQWMQEDSQYWESASVTRLPT